MVYSDMADSWNQSRLKGYEMIQLPVNGQGIHLIPVSSKTRPKFVYRDGQRTSDPVMRNGRQVYTFDAALALSGVQIGVGRVESCTEVIPNTGFGSLLTGKGDGELRISPKDSFELRVVFRVDEVIPVVANDKEANNERTKPNV